MVDTVNVTRQMQRNAEAGIADFYLHQHASGEVEWAGSMELPLVLELVKKKISELEAADTNKWIPDQPLPDLPASLELVLKTPDMLKKYSNKCMDWLLNKQGLKKAGQEGFLGWAVPMDRQLFTINDAALSEFSNPTFSLEQIVAWASMLTLKNGFQAGARNILLPHSGVKSWLSFLRIFVEVCFSFYVILLKVDFTKSKTYDILLQWCLRISQRSPVVATATRQVRNEN